MRKLTHALVLAFAFGTLAPIAAQAGAGCSYGDHSSKKNDVETPPPAASAAKGQTQS